MTVLPRIQQVAQVSGELAVRRVHGIVGTQRAHLLECQSGEQGEKFHGGYCDAGTA